MEPLEIILQSAVGIGTIALAYFSWRSIQSSDRQLKFIKKQTDLFLSQQQPDIQVKYSYFEANKLILTLHNSGKGTAKDIAVACIFDIVKPISWSKGWLGRYHVRIPSISELGTRKYEIKTDDGQHLVLNMKLNDKSILSPSVGVIFPMNDEHSNFLSEGLTKTFQCEPFFSLKVKKNRFCLSPDYDQKIIPYDKLRSLLIENNIDEISVLFNLYSKDKLQNVKNHGNVANFVIKLSSDETLENAYNRGQRGSYPLDKDEIKTTVGWLDFDTYLHGKYLDPEEKV